VVWSGVEEVTSEEDTDMQEAATMLAALPEGAKLREFVFNIMFGAAS